MLRNFLEAAFRASGVPGRSRHGFAQTPGFAPQNHSDRALTLPGYGRPKSIFSAVAELDDAMTRL
ncbi:hypothetical protein CCL07_14300 [Pseudomonas congelans]|nr:hypothetical protein CCL07_14300 [Pseudomonas congelans]